MAPGSVIVDIAAERGGNCELTQPGETVERGGVRILGPVNLPSTIPYHASQMYAQEHRHVPEVPDRRTASWRSTARTRSCAKRW